MPVDRERMYAELQRIAVERGGELLSTEYVNSKAKMLWRCGEGHEWEATSNRVKSGRTWCPYCAGSVPLTLLSAQQLAARRNGECFSAEYVNSCTKMYWKCSEGHEWKATFNSIKSGRTWCPQCAGNMLLTLRTAQQLAVERGGKCLAFLYRNSRTKMRWQCSEGHEWEATYDSIKNSGSWCPQCAALAHNLSLNIIQQVAIERGGECLATEYVNCETKVRWRCSKGHIWEATSNKVKNQGTWCPQCAGNIAFTLADLILVAIERGGECLAMEYVNCVTKVRWRCSKGHEWEATFNDIKNNGTWCPYCAGNAPLTLLILQQLADERGGECLATEYRNAHANERWRCSEGHEWEATSDCIRNQGHWCPYCAGLAPLTLEIIQQDAIERGGECLAIEYVNCMTKVGWRCSEGHEWITSPTHIRSSDTWCPVCAGNASHSMDFLQSVAIERGGKCLDDEYVNAFTKMRWRCSEGHEWEATFNSIKNSRTWCPFCRNKSENAVRTMLRYALELNFLPHSPKALERLGIELRNTAGNLMHLDGFNIDICAAFEYHGWQHTDGGSYLHGYIPDSFERRQKDDRLKREQCEEAGIVLFEIYEEEHGGWPHLNRLYVGLCEALSEYDLEVNKPNLSDAVWMRLITRDRKQTTLKSCLFGNI